MSLSEYKFYSTQKKAEFIKNLEIETKQHFIYISFISNCCIIFQFIQVCDMWRYFNTFIWNTDIFVFLIFSKYFISVTAIKIIKYL